MNLYTVVVKPDESVNAKNGWLVDRSGQFFVDLGDKITLPIEISKDPDKKPKSADGLVSNGFLNAKKRIVVKDDSTKTDRATVTLASREVISLNGVQSNAIKFDECIDGYQVMIFIIQKNIQVEISLGEKQKFFMTFKGDRLECKPKKTHMKDMIRQVWNIIRQMWRSFTLHIKLGKHITKKK